MLAPAYAGDPPTFKSEDRATKFCEAGNVVWFNPASKIYFDPGSQFYGKTKAGGVLDAPVAWVWTVRDGKAVANYNYHDTDAWRLALAGA